jgi:hypothetical protein
VEEEAKRELQQPPDSSKSDVLVQKHVTGISISLFILIALILLLAMVGIVFFGKFHR